MDGCTLEQRHGAVFFEQFVNNLRPVIVLGGVYREEEGFIRIVKDDDKERDD